MGRCGKMNDEAYHSSKSRRRALLAHPALV
ncbi:hypothetical protein BCEN4_290006 [Burkholderia cenocepacia]|nr:hypothetical protein BCEN4_290006 [Burkholderia cenocepacia]